MKTRFLFSLSVLLLSMSKGSAQHSSAKGIFSPIDSTRVIDWTYSGIPGGIPNRTNVYATINASTYGNGASDATTGIQNALSACPANQVVLLSAGTFKIDTKLVVPSNVTLRGSGPQQTILDGHGNTRGMIVFGQEAGMWVPPLISITAGLNVGSTSINVNDASTISVGQYLAVSQLNDPAYVTNVGVGGSCTWCDEGYNGTRTMGQMVEVISKNGNTLGISSPGLYFTYSASLSPSVSVLTAGAKYAGVEDLQVYMNNTGYTTNFLMDGSAYCWIKNVESNYADGDHVRVFFGYRDEVRDSYFHDAYVHGPGGTDADIFIANRTSGTLVENNQLRRMHASIMINWGASGNVISYNYSDGNFKENAQNCMMTDMTFHGAHPMFNLWEGNVAISFTPDSYWGSSSHNTAFRNWLRGTTKANPPYTGRGPEDTVNGHWEVQNTRAIALDYANRYYNLVGNVAGSPEMLALTYYNNGTQPIPATPMTLAPQYRVYDNLVNGYSFGYASSGDDGTSALANQLPYSTLFWHGDVNFINMSTVWDANTSNHNLPPSLYLTTKPSWFGNTSWPLIGPDVAGYTNKNPAQLCYEQGKMPGCPLSATGVHNNSTSENSLTVYPNPGNGFFTITSPMKNCSLKLFDVTGNMVRNFSNVKEFPFTIEKGNILSGVYFIELRSENKVERSKLVIN